MKNIVVSAILTLVAFPVLADSSPDLNSYGFGVGIGVTHLSKADIKDTAIANGIVRVTDDSNNKKGFWLETHYLLDRYKCGTYCSHGPFVAAQVDSSNGGLFDSIGLGYMLSLKRTPIGDTKSNSAFNIGLAWVTTRVQRLGDGFTENAPLPTGEESVRYRKFDANGVLLMFSFNFLSVPGTDALK